MEVLKVDLEDAFGKKDVPQSLEAAQTNITL